MDLIDIFRTFYSRAIECTFFSNAHGAFFRIDHMMGHKTNPSKFKKIEIMPAIFSDHSGMKLQINIRGK